MYDDGHYGHYKKGKKRKLKTGEERGFLKDTDTNALPVIPYSTTMFCSCENGSTTDDKSMSRVSFPRSRLITATLGGQVQRGCWAVSTMPLSNTHKLPWTNKVAISFVV